MTTSGRQARAPSSTQRWVRIAGVGFAVVAVVLVRAWSRPQLPAASEPPPAQSRSTTSELRSAPVLPRVELSAAERADSFDSADATAPMAVMAPSPVPIPPEVIPSAVPLTAVSTAANATATPIAPVSKPRRVLRSAVAAWTKPGLCTTVVDAAGTRETVVANFRLLQLGERGTLYLDPRLPTDAELPLLGYLSQAETEVGTRLGLYPPRPVTFVYSDQQLMKASACINEDVAAFYDGALHVVAGRADVLASIMHEYAHHAMFNAGLMAPTWAQEGIAMNIAKERWWRESNFLQALLDNPFSMDDMDRAIAYKLKPAQAVAFYVQSAALVECVLRERHWSLRELFAKLSSGSGADSVTYDMPELERASFLSDCVAQGLGALPAGQ